MTNHAELSRLITEMADGAISDADFAHLESLLLHDDEARRYYLEHRSLSVELAWSYGNPPTVPVSEPAALPQAPARRSRLVVATATIIALAAAITLLVWFKPFFPTSNSTPTTDPQPEIAHIRRMFGQVMIHTSDGQTQVATAGTKILPGQTIHTLQSPSFAIVEYSDGTRLEFDSNSTARLSFAKSETNAGKLVYLAKGALHANVVKQPPGRPLLLRTPHAEIRVLGTRLTSITEAIGTRLELDEGKVEMTRLADGKMIQLEKGSFAIATAMLRPFLPHPLPPAVRKPWRLLKETPPSRGAVYKHVEYAQGGDTVLAIAADATFDWWHADKGLVKRQRHAHPDKVLVLNLAADQNCFATWCRDRLVRRWHVNTKQCEIIAPPKKQIRTITKEPHSHEIALAFTYKIKRTRLSDVLLLGPNRRDWQKLVTAQPGDIYKLTFSPDGQTLAWGTRDGRVSLYDRRTKQRQVLRTSYHGRIELLRFSPNGKLLATGVRNHPITLWNVAGGEQLATLDDDYTDFVDAVFSPDGKIFAAVGGLCGRIVTLWDVAEQRRLVHFRSSVHTMESAAFSPDGQTLATVGWDRRLRLWQIAVN